MGNPAKNTICLWYDGNAEDAARFYAQTFRDSSLAAVHRLESACLRRQRLVGNDRKAGIRLLQFLVDSAQRP